MKDGQPDSKDGKWTVLVTGAQLVAEAEDYLAAQECRPIYVDGYAGAAALRQAAGDLQVDAILVRQGKVDRSVIEASSGLKVIAKHGSGVDNIDLAAASEHGIPVLRAISANAQSVAELTISLALSLLKDIPILDRAVKGGAWPKTSYQGRDISGVRFGLVGFGDIGKRTAKLAGALGMETLAFDPAVAEAAHEGTVLTRELDEVLGGCDIVSLHCPLTERTRNLIGARELGLMGRESFLINTARGGLVDETALHAALKDKLIAGAALDSFAQEPPAGDDKLFELGNLIATPHVGGASRSALRNMAMQSASNIVTYLQSQTFEQATLANRALAVSQSA